MVLNNAANIKYIENVHVFYDEVGQHANAAFKAITDLGEIRRNKLVNLQVSNKVQNTSIEFFDAERLIQFIEENKIKRIFFHSLPFSVTKILREIKIRNNAIVIFWIFWSYEFYDLPERQNDLYTKETLPYLTNRRGYPQYYRAIKRVVGTILGKDVYSLSKTYRRFKYVDYLCTTFYSDYELIVKEANVPGLKWMPYSYFCIDDLVKNVRHLDLDQDADKLMIGHSASPTNNHFEVFHKIRKWKQRSLYLPLAYGDPIYRGAIGGYLKSDFSNWVIDIQEGFVPLEEYYQKLKKVGYAVFNNRPQKAFGNIVILLWLGVKVFLREESTIYKDLKLYGFHIFSLQKYFFEENLHPLTEAEIKNNRRLLMERFNRELVNQQLLNVLTL